ncbi:MAG: ATP-binding protein [Pseudomonadota bacterium]
MTIPTSFLARNQDQEFEANVLRILNAFAVDVMSIPSADDLFWYVAQNVVGRLNFIDCVIYEANSDQTELIQVAAMGEKNPFGRSIINPLRIPFGEGITGRVAQQRRAIIVDDLMEDQSYIADTQPARSEICVPMVFRNRVVGVIDSEHPSPGAFGDTELEVLVTIAAMTSAKLELLEEADRSNQRYQDLVRSHAQLTEETNNRRALESRLFEARKLESVGRLAGGIAHDFNNLLTVISGNLELLEAGGNEQDKRDFLASAQTASKCAAHLVQNMLSFSQKSYLKPVETDLSALVRETCRWSKHILSPDIEFSLSVSEDTWPVMVDVDAAKTALLNLVMNAQDAMPDGGRLQIATENAKLSIQDIQSREVDLIPGRYVCLRVQDSGKGIPKDRLQQVFDPFYTTKDGGGMGAGLGLSTVLGFMKQSCGTVTVDSVADQGTTFRLYFPASLSPLAVVS